MFQFLWNRGKAQIDVAVTLGLAWLVARAGLPVATVLVVVAVIACAALIKKNLAENLISHSYLKSRLAGSWNG
jgi:hypothetical protein